jgi:enolase
VHAREVLDSRGKPTVEVEICCANSRPGSAIVPSGASTGKFEAAELRDGDSARLDGLGVRRAVAHVNCEIAGALIGRDADDQQTIDESICRLDGTPNKSRLGANALLGVSLAAAHAAAAAKQIALVEHLRQVWQRVPGKRCGTAAVGTLGAAYVLPLPMVNMISGGLHAGQNLDLQDFLILPVGAASFRQALDWTVAIYRRLGRVLSEKGYEGVLVGDEGGFGPKLRSNEEAIELILRAVEAAGLRPGVEVCLGLDVASSHFFFEGKYRIRGGPPEGLDAEAMVGLLESWVDRYPIVSIEDGAAEDDWPAWKLLTERLGNRVQLIGDDLFVTNVERVEKGIDAAIANSVLIKVNQCGTLWETLTTARLALDCGYLPVISARSGETEDATIADLAVAIGAGQIKIGSVARSERLAKYNQLLRLEERLGRDALWLGGTIL